GRRPVETGVDVVHAPEDGVDRGLMFFEGRLALGGDTMQLLAAHLRFDGHIAQFFQQRQGRVDHSRAGAVSAADLLLDGLDNLVAMARLFGDELQDHELQVALIEDPFRAAPLVTAEAAAVETEFAGRTGLVTVVMMSKHGILSTVFRYIDKKD